MPNQIKYNKVMKILGIETSCDETAASIIKADKGKIQILSNIVSSQIKIHQKYGGVYPELASRAHTENIIPVIKESLSNAKMNLKEIDLIAVTFGPGLVGSLLIGVNTAKTIGYCLNKPIVPVNHLEGHIYSALSGEIRKKIFPAVALIVSGGHTSLILMRGHGKFQIIGETRDDAAGEAFDKVAKILNLGYPGGPAIEAAASKPKTHFVAKGNSAAKAKYAKLKTKLPRPMLDTDDFNFSFSGLKTAVLYMIKQMKSDRIENVRKEIASEFQQAVVDVLVSKTIRAAQKYKVKSIILCGGVSANSSLREELKLKIENLKFKIDFLVPPKILFTDNAVMIGIAGFFKYSHLKTKSQKWYDVKADSNAKLKNW